MLVSVSAKSAPAELRFSPFAPMKIPQWHRLLCLTMLWSTPIGSLFVFLPRPIAEERERECFRPPGYDDHDRESYFDLRDNIYFNVELEDKVSWNTQDSFSNDVSLEELSVLDFEIDESDV